MAQHKHLTYAETLDLMYPDSSRTWVDLGDGRERQTILDEAAIQETLLDNQTQRKTITAYADEIGLPKEGGAITITLDAFNKRHVAVMNAYVDVLNTIDPNVQYAHWPTPVEQSKEYGVEGNIRTNPHKWQYNRWERFQNGEWVEGPEDFSKMGNYLGSDGTNAYYAPASPSPTLKPTVTSGGVSIEQIKAALTLVVRCPGCYGEANLSVQWLETLPQDANERVIVPCRYECSVRTGTDTDPKTLRGRIKAALTPTQ